MNTMRKPELAVFLPGIGGVLLAGYFTALEFPALFVQGFAAYFFGLPTRAFGLIVYLAIFALSLRLHAEG